MRGEKSLSLALVLMVLSVPVSAGLAVPDVYGYLGYGYRSVNDSSSTTQSHQLSGTINAETYLWQPWFAVADLSLAYTGDKGQNSSDIYDSEAGTSASIESSSASHILTGDLGVEVLPRSNIPISFRVHRTDSRVEYGGEGVTPIVFVGKEYSTSHIGFKVAPLTNLGRMNFRFDYRTSGESGGARYGNRTLGLDADLRWAKQRMVVRTSYEKGSYELADRANTNLIFDISNFYAASRHFRIDSKASVYRYDRSFLDIDSVERRFSRRDIAQASTNLFYRPVSRPLSLSAGVRVSKTDGYSADASAKVSTNDQLQFSLISGLFYRLNQNMRLDFSVSSIFNRVGDVSSGDHRQHAGWRYSSPLFGQLDKNLVYKWYVAANVDARKNAMGSFRSETASIGQNLSKVLYFGERTGTTSLRFYGNQAVKYTSSLVEQVGRIDHSLSSSFNQRIWDGQTLVQVTFSDSRDVMDSLDVRQLVNFQFNRTQDVTGNSSLTGNYTAQYVLHEYEEVANYAGVDEFTGQVVAVGDKVRRERDVVTMTGGVKYAHRRFLWVPRLAFNLGYRVAQTSTEGAIDRTDANAGVFYSIGMLDLSATYSLTDADGRNYDLLYFRAMRRY